MKWTAAEDCQRGIDAKSHGARYDQTLDGIRALAAITVAFYHAKAPGLPGGFLGVDIFFVLSGFLITRLLVDEYDRNGTVDLRRFMVRRLRRLYPALLLFLVAYLLVSPILFPGVSPDKHLADVAFSAFYLSNYARALDVPLSVLGHVWSLAVEVQFYLLWPLIFLILGRVPRSLWLALIGLAYVLATGWRWWQFDHVADPWLVYTGLDTRCSALLLGCLLARLNISRLHPCFGMVALLLLLVAVTFFSWPWVDSARFGFTIAELSTALLILGRPDWLGGRLLAWFGRISYGFYLWHFLAMRALRPLEWSWSSVFLVGSLLGLAAAVLSYYVVERRFHPARTRDAAPASSAGTVRC